MVIVKVLLPRINSYPHSGIQQHDALHYNISMLLCNALNAIPAAVQCPAHVKVVCDVMLVDNKGSSIFSYKHTIPKNPRILDHDTCIL